MFCSGGNAAKGELTGAGHQTWRSLQNLIKGGLGYEGEGVGPSGREYLKYDAKKEWPKGGSLFWGALFKMRHEKKGWGAAKVVPNLGRKEKLKRMERGKKKGPYRKKVILGGAAHG